jgi:GNAT acetyltransferase-like protein
VCRRGMAKNMRTDRLTLVTLTPYLARVALENRATLGMMLGARVPVTWPGADFARMLERVAEGGERASLWAEQIRQIVHEEDRTLIDEALARPEVCRITAACHDDNAASLKVLEKLGMHFVGATGDTLRFELRTA